MSNEEHEFHCIQAAIALRDLADKVESGNFDGLRFEWLHGRVDATLLSHDNLEKITVNLLCPGLNIGDGDK